MYHPLRTLQAYTVLYVAGKEKTNGKKLDLCRLSWTGQEKSPKYYLQTKYRKTKGYSTSIVCIKNPSSMYPRPMRKEKAMFDWKIIILLLKNISFTENCFEITSVYLFRFIL